MPEPREYGAPPQVTSKWLADYLEVMSKSVMQTGISWAVVDKKWPELREASLGFDPERLLALSERDVEALLTDPRIIRNRTKMNAIFHNAARMLELEQQHGTFRKDLRSKADYWDWAKMLGKDFKFMGDMGAFLRRVARRDQPEAGACPRDSSGAGCARNCHSSSTSYTLLTTPAQIKGQPNEVASNIAPAMSGANAAARLRGTLVTLAAAARSSGGTTAIT
ncbi:MAG: hypothetical protein EXR68_01190 [Dehalococcoidia bacterium]|nr:hypothetical protein [Dehalococcoidia bacterium]